MERDGYTESLWQANTGSYVSEGHLPVQVVDVAIVGGGITGINTALLLQKAGKTCAVIEAKNIGFGTSGGTTAHLNTMMDTPYYQIKKTFGEKGVKLVANAALNAIELIKRNIEEYSINCTFQEKTAYLFAQNEEQSNELQKIAESLIEAGFKPEFVKEIPLSLPFEKAFSLDKQAQFNPIEYLYAIAKEFEKAGGIIVQQCRVTEMKNENGIAELKCTKGKFKARNVVYATHIPPGVNVLHFQCAPYRSYAMALELYGNDYPDALVYDLYEPYHYYRTQEKDGRRYLIAGGGDHKTAHHENTTIIFDHLESYFRKFMNIKEVAYRWSSQYFESSDGLPFTGVLPGNSSNIYVATGFGGNGMIYGTFSALLLRDLICGNKNEYAELFSPSRLKAAEIPTVAKETADVVKKFVGDRLSISKIEAMVDLAKGEAKVVKYNNQSVALYKDEMGNIHALNPSCPHIGCMVNWNSAELTWDCPCHGSRFSHKGELLTGPAKTDLEQLELDKD